MPLYTYKHPKKNKTIDVFQGMNDVHEYIENGVKWERVYYAPNAQIDSLSNISAHDSKAFIEKTGQKRGTMGDLQDLAKELSEKRGGENDPVKKAYYKEWSKKRKNKHEHPDLAAKKSKKKLSKLGIKFTK